MKFLSEFDSFLMYIDNHTKSHNFLKISMFSNKMFTFSSSAQLFEKINISHEIQFFSPKIDIFAQKLMLRKTLVTLLQSLHDMILSLLEKWKYPSILVFLQDFRLYQWNTDNEKIEIKRIVIFLKKLTTKFLLIPIVISHEIDS